MDTPDARPAATLAEAEEALLSRWPETRLEPSLDRIQAFVELLGDPQHAAPLIHLTGTNGKTSTSRMIDTVLRTLGLRTGRFTSPHLESITERISLDGEPLSPERFVEVFNDVAPYTHLVDGSEDHPLSFFETVVGMAYAAFADAPVDAAIVEVGMGGSWDATNVADARVAVITPIDVDHAQYLGERPADIAVEKSGIIKPGTVVVSAAQAPEVLAVLHDRVQEVGASLLVAGRDFGLEQRVVAHGGQMIRIAGLRATYDELFLPLYGAHQAENAALALAAVEAFTGGAALGGEVVEQAFAEFTSPGRLEVVRRSPSIVLDSAHNPHGARALAAALEDAFTFHPLVAVVGVMGDKDASGMLDELTSVVHHVVCTQNSTDRAMPAEELAETARGIFGSDRVDVDRDLASAIERAATLSETGTAIGESVGSGGVLVTGSVVTVGEARRMLRRTRGGTDA
ncbi:bifunctional folylpolyglutamate synthase/dihydrofolate synthase [Nocardioides massiliensis]|uniref:tetrahydrofolate synthase n=1 Tax=Nocardioides massiliensis TaxID=1325935 RepID=A0ABT9NPK4_9ACTN|nr:folylpolyglutamate synthase/dihydrofolate synthase family protein [Nocardioides massiliensis]MDP9822340.1 dihydrofolate synthase/folylpolyglutamate synthase [Nocardioides massiliensis]